MDKLNNFDGVFVVVVVTLVNCHQNYDSKAIWFQLTWKIIDTKITKLPKSSRSQEKDTLLAGK